MKKYFGIDYGKTRIGIAVSDALGITARGVETITWNGHDWTKPIERIAQLVAEHGVEGIVLGLPRRTDGLVSESEENARYMAQLLFEKTGIQPILRDERFTTVIAQRILYDSTVKKKKQRSVIDQVAAEVILREFLEANRKNSM